MFSGGGTLVVAVSGGPDSTALLHVLARLRMDARLVVAHVDHGLSPASEEIAAGVARRAAQAGLDAHVARARGLEGPNLQARARDFRYSFFETIARQEEAEAIATGHTLDDRVETTLQRLIHGAGTRGLAGIPHAAVPGGAQVKRVRPMLDVRRAEARAYCEEVGLEFVDDPANIDERFDRAAVRELVLKTIEDRWGEGAVRAMATSIDRLAEDDRALAQQAALLYEGSAETDEAGRLTLELPMMRELPRALQRRLLEIAVGPLRDRGPGIEEVLGALAAPETPVGVSFDLPRGTRVEITRDLVRVIPDPREADDIQASGETSS